MPSTVREVTQLDNVFTDDVDFVVEASSFEALSLWREYSKRGFVTENYSIIKNLGSFGGMPVCLSLTIGKVGKTKFVIYNPTSVVVDYRMVGEFIDKHYGDCRRVDALNFGQVMNAAKDV